MFVTFCEDNFLPGDSFLQCSVLQHFLIFLCTQNRFVNRQPDQDPVPYELLRLCLIPTGLSAKQQ
jgi:hypothetical protein